MSFPPLVSALDGRFSSSFFVPPLVSVFDGRFPIKYLRFTGCCDTRLCAQLVSAKISIVDVR